MRPASLLSLNQELIACKGCTLHKQTTQSVPGIGTDKPYLMLLGESPGEQEDQQGVPFVGPAGQALQDILTELQWRLFEIYITNTVKHRPPKNRNPTLQELKACGGFLSREIETIKPKAIVALGRIATETLIRLSDREPPKGSFRGLWFNYQDSIPVVATWHPSYLIRQTTQDSFLKIRSEIIEDLEFAYEVVNQRSIDENGPFG